MKQVIENLNDSRTLIVLLSVVIIVVVVSSLIVFFIKYGESEFCVILFAIGLFSSVFIVLFFPIGELYGNTGFTIDAKPSLFSNTIAIYKNKTKNDEGLLIGEINLETKEFSAENETGLQYEALMDKLYEITKLDINPKSLDYKTVENEVSLSFIYKDKTYKLITETENSNEIKVIVNDEE